jgi:hypothetical protein
VRFNLLISRMHEHFSSRALGALYGKFVSCGGMTYFVFIKLYESTVEPILFYGSGIWGTKQNDTVSCHPFRRLEAQCDTVVISLSPSVRFNLLVSRMHESLLSNIPRSVRRTMALFRTGALPLAVETGRYSRPQVHLNDRLCKLCENSVVEDEQHFMMNCPLYSDIRFELMQNAKRLIVNFDCS